MVLMMAILTRNMSLAMLNNSFLCHCALVLHLSLVLLGFSAGPFAFLGFFFFFENHPT